MTKYQYTTQRQLRAAFWEAHSGIPRRRITNYSGKGLMFPTDTRVAWVDWLDYVSRDGLCSQALAYRATLEP